VKNFVLGALLALGCVSGALAQTAAPAPTPAIDPQNILNLQLSTGGTVRILMRPDKAPGHVARVKLLTRAGFYDGVIFHRVIEGFMAQTGDPDGNGQGGSPLPDLKAEFNDLPHFRGVVSMARTDSPDTANSQFFIVFMPSMRLDGKYTGFGRVISGMEFVDTIERGEPPVTPSRIVRAWIDADGPNAARVALVVPPPAPKVDAPAAPPAPAVTPAEAPKP
jgi:cyclophilin family peptidyl-prolyl cis-trans isomerase